MIQSLLTERVDHLEYFATQLEKVVRHVVVLQGGMGTKDRRLVKERLAVIPDTEERLVLATGRYIGEGFDDARLDTLFLALPVSWKGTLIQYTGRLHRLHPAKKEVRIFDYVDREVYWIDVRVITSAFKAGDYPTNCHSSRPIRGHRSRS